MVGCEHEWFNEKHLFLLLSINNSLLIDFDMVI